MIACHKDCMCVSTQGRHLFSMQLSGCDLHGCYRGCPELIDTLDKVLDKTSPIYSFRREPNVAAHDMAIALHAECTALWREGGGPQKRSLCSVGCISSVDFLRNTAQVCVSGQGFVFSSCSFATSLVVGLFGCMPCSKIVQSAVRC